MSATDSLIKSQFLGKDQFVWWIGQVAHPSVWRDSKTEIKLFDTPAEAEFSWAYRAKVRIIGYHPFSGTELPDKDLPWAHVMTPASGGSAHGALGQSLQLVGGETVFGFFMDGDEAQQPVIFGSLYRAPSAISQISGNVAEVEGSSNYRPYPGVDLQPGMEQGASSSAPLQNQNLGTPEANSGNSVSSQDPMNNTDQIFPESDADTQFARGGTTVTKPNGCENNTLSEITNAIRSFIATVNSLTSFLGKYIDSVNNAIEDIKRIIRKTKLIIMGAIKKIMKNLRNKLLKMLGKRFRDFVGLIVPDPQVQPISNAFSKIMDIIFCIFEKLGIEMGDFIGNFLRDLIGKTIAAPICAAEQAAAAMISALINSLEKLLKPVMDGLSWLTGALGSVAGALKSVSGLMNQLISFLDCDSLSCKKSTDWSSGWGLSEKPADNLANFVNNISISDSLLGGPGGAVTLNDLASAGHGKLDFLTLLGGNYLGFTRCNNKRDNPQDQDDIGPTPYGFTYPRCIPPKVELVGISTISKKASAYAVVAQDGSILSVEIIDGGRGYQEAPAVSIIDKTNHGGGADAEAFIDDDGTVNRIVLRDKGGGYCQGSVYLPGIPTDVDTGTTVPDTTPPVFVVTTPRDNAVGIDTTINITIEFSEEVLADCGKITITELDTNAKFAEIEVTDRSQVSFSNQKTVVINPKEDLEYDTEYFIGIDQCAFTDLAGNQFAGIADTSTFNFTTRSVGGISSTPVGIVTTVHVDRPGYGYTSGDKGTYGDCTFDLILTPAGQVVGVKNVVCKDKFNTIPDLRINTSTGRGAALYPVIAYDPNASNTVAGIDTTTTQYLIVNKVDCPGKPLV